MRTNICIYIYIYIYIHIYIYIYIYMNGPCTMYASEKVPFEHELNVWIHIILHMRKNLF